MRLKRHISAWVAAVGMTALAPMAAVHAEDVP